jgi:hypothetical protein
MKEYKRNCPICNKELIHTHYVSFRASLKNNKPCSKCSNKERANRPEERKKNRERQKGTNVGTDNPFYGKTHSNKTKQIIKNKRKEQKIPSGVNNPLFGKKLEEIVGVDRANKMKTEKSKMYSGDGNPMFGKPSPQGSGNGWSGWYNEWFFRSILELSYMVKVIERYSMKWESGESKKYKISYINVDGVIKNYFPDFVINDKYVVEIKPTSLMRTLKVVEKLNAGVEYCNKNNMIYKMTNIPPLTNLELKNLIDSNKVKLTNRYRKKYEEIYRK